MKRNKLFYSFDKNSKTKNANRLLKLNNVVKIFFLMSFIFLSPFASSNDVPRSTKNVIGVFDSSTNKALNTHEIYGDVINYYIPDNIRHITISIGQNPPIDIDLEQEIEFAIREWTSAGLRFNRLTSNTGTTRYIGYRLGSDGSAYGYTSFNSPNDNDAITRVTLDTRGFSSQIPDYYRGLLEYNRIPSNATISDLVRMMVRLTILHETGHALGLAHHDENGVLLPNPTRIGREVARCGITISRPSVMVSGRDGSFISILSQFLNRPVTIDDIVASRNDLEGAHNMFTISTPRTAISLFCVSVFMALKGTEL